MPSWLLRVLTEAPNIFFTSIFATVAKRFRCQSHETLEIQEISYKVPQQTIRDALISDFLFERSGSASLLQTTSGCDRMCCIASARRINNPTCASRLGFQLLEHVKKFGAVFRIEADSVRTVHPRHENGRKVPRVCGEGKRDLRQCLKKTTQRVQFACMAKPTSVRSREAK